ncbi:MAG TPA: hypothetical protein VN829_02535 [Dongiaceae bacterium]|nr:hypothetical protein [Dongiaceae bacterium]
MALTEGSFGDTFCFMSSTDVTEAVAKLASLSQERADRVLSLIDDLAELEALEDAEDLEEAREVLAEVKAPSAARPDGIRPTISFDQLRRELGLGP